MAQRRCLCHCADDQVAKALGGLSTSAAVLVEECCRPRLSPLALAPRVHTIAMGSALVPLFGEMAESQSSPIEYPPPLGTLCWCGLLARWGKLGAPFVRIPPFARPVSFRYALCPSQGNPLTCIAHQSARRPPLSTAMLRGVPRFCIRRDETVGGHTGERRSNAGPMQSSGEPSGHRRKSTARCCAPLRCNAR